MKAPGGFLGKIFGFLNKATSEEREKTEQELPFAVMIFTLMAASGISPYDSWKKMRKLSFLPTFKKEADEVIRQVEVLGKDPLTVMQQRGEQTHSKLYRNFLGGFVSSVRSGGKLADYMKSQLKSIFELRYINLNRSIERIAALVEAYSVMLIVVLCTYILFVVFSSSSVMDLMSSSSISISPVISYLIAFVVMPVMSGIFILMAHNMQRSAFPDLKDLYKKALIFIIPVFAVIGVFGIIGNRYHQTHWITRNRNHRVSRCISPTCLSNTTTSQKSTTTLKTPSLASSETSLNHRRQVFHQKKALYKQPNAKITAPSLSS